MNTDGGSEDRPLHEVVLYLDGAGRTVEPEVATRIVVLHSTPSGSVVRMQEYVLEGYEGVDRRMDPVRGNEARVQEERV